LIIVHRGWRIKVGCSGGADGTKGVLAILEWSFYLRARHLWQLELFLGKKLETQ
jgi:hypothetical protein